MDMDMIGSGISLDAPNNPGPAVFYARVGSPSPTDPNMEQLITDRPAGDWMNTIQNAAKSSLSFFTGGSATPSAAASGVAGTVATKAGYVAKKVQGEVGKAYYGAVASLDTAVASTAQTAQKVATGIAWGSTAIVIIIAIVLFAQFRIAAKGAA